MWANKHSCLLAAVGYLCVDFEISGAGRGFDNASDIKMSVYFTNTGMKSCSWLLSLLLLLLVLLLVLLLLLLLSLLPLLLLVVLLWVYLLHRYHAFSNPIPIPMSKQTYVCSHVYYVLWHYITVCYIVY